jgi:glutamate N-acetyltransferase/amino-acid N-acetyltransferase
MTAPAKGSGVTAAQGVRASGVHCGIRRKRPDLAVIVSDRPASAAAVFTRNLVQAAPVLLCKEQLEKSGGRARAFVVTSGNANACTGPQGEAAARRTVVEAARALDLPLDEILVASTGVIGEQLDVEALVSGLPAAAAALSEGGAADFATAILTTDTCTKEAVRTVELPGGTITLGGVAKGSGMIHPDMATTLAFICTDAQVEEGLLQRFLTRATELSFNRITVDGDTSTNDMVGLLANGAAEVAVRADDPAAVAAFQQALTEILVELARAVVADGEGAGTLITVEVTSALTDAEALQVARTIAGSPLVKTAVHGNDANWGRIIAAAGRAGVPLEPERLRVGLNGIEVLAPGYVSSFSERDATEALGKDEVVITVDLGAGHGQATTWTCDLTAGYIDINASYRS